MNKVIVIFILGLLWTVKVNGQSKIELIGSADDDKILLRWAPTDAVSWQYGLEYGYTVERYTISRDSSLVKPPIRIKLNPVAIKPEPLAQWENLSNENDYAAVAAQAIYGETFELTDNYRSDISQIVHKTREQEQRFSFALFAADQSFEVAQLSGLALVDINAKVNEKYMYKVISNVPDSLQSIAEATLFIGIEDKKPLPKPMDFEGAFGNRTVMLKWNRTFFEREYISYVIERSNDGGRNFKPINKTPLVNTFEGATPDAKNYYKLDSLPQNNVEYRFRVRGISSFGEFGPYSDTISGKGYEEIAAQAAITGHQIINNETVKLKWEFPNDKEPLINGFILQRSAKPNGPYSHIHPDTLSTDNREFVDSKPMSTNYYRIGFTNNHQFKFSHPYLVQLEDSIPPSSPTGLSYTIDSTGIVNLSWEQNVESDLLGYRVYRSNFKNSEFIQVTHEAIENSQYTDTLTLNTLTKNIYYYVKAVDVRFNNSEFSEFISVSKPDIVPPVPPVFKHYEVKGDTLYLEWVKSSSSDVSHYLLYKNDFKSKDWRLVSKLENNINSYTEGLKTDGTFRYIVVAVDNSGNESDNSNSIEVDVQLKQQNVFKFFEAKWSKDKNSIILEWELVNSNLPNYYFLYRASDARKISLLKKISGEDLNYEDLLVAFTNKYSYVISYVGFSGEVIYSPLIKIGYE